MSANDTKLTGISNLIQQYVLNGSSLRITIQPTNGRYNGYMFIPSAYGEEILIKSGQKIMSVDADSPLEVLNILNQHCIDILESNT